MKEDQIVDVSILLRKGNRKSLEVEGGKYQGEREEGKGKEKGRIWYG